MEVYESEKEQVEKLRTWAKEHGPAAAVGAVLALSVVFGSKAWVAYKQDQADHASIIFNQLIGALDTKDLNAVDQRGGTLVSDFASSPYAAFAALAMAKAKLEAGDTLAAKVNLRWVLDNSKLKQVKHSARIRLARILIADGEFAEAGTLLSLVAPPAFVAAYEELRGDLASAQGDVQIARQAYERALVSENLPPANRVILEMKRDNAGYLNSKGDTSRIEAPMAEMPGEASSAGEAQ